MKEHERVIEYYCKSVYGWTEVPFKDLTDGDIFRIFDCGERYFDPSTGNNVWIAVDKPYINKDGILTVKTLY